MKKKTAAKKPTKQERDETWAKLLKTFRDLFGIYMEEEGKKRTLVIPAGISDTVMAEIRKNAKEYHIAVRIGDRCLKTS
jgi:hypothetical protein